ncbi:ferrochelatase [Bacillus sp. 1P06AnD]|uniref:ferrochelatase n=1 Tax=Bacillus sp. 1P06AnD TaxID=3132208 RepID=UPI0039A1C2DB
MKKTAILLVNLGTPASPETRDVKKYLQEFLSDPRVIDAPRWKWMPILHGIILRSRPQKSAALYHRIWTSHGSPIMHYSLKQRDLLEKRIGGKNINVALAMNYGEPSIPSQLQKLQEWGMEKLVVLPLFPQYSSTTTASIFDSVYSFLQKGKSLPEMCMIRDFPDDPHFIDLLEKRVKTCSTENGKPDTLILSYHGIPQRYADEGDDYPLRCRKTTEALRKRLPDYEVAESFQSKFGKEPWLAPSTNDVLTSLASQGKTHVQIMAPAFTADCLETLEELEEEHREIFMKAGGKNYHYLAAANDDPLFIDCLESLVRTYI